MGNQKDFRTNPTDHAMKLELITKNYGLLEAEKYFMSIPDSAAKKAACLPLLRGYVRVRDTSKAEIFMEKLYELGLVVNPHPYNEMMKLYISTCGYRKVPLVIRGMKRNKVLCNVLSYNLWMSACGEDERYGVAAVETVFRAMQNDANVECFKHCCILQESARFYVCFNIILSAQLNFKADMNEPKSNI